jgi:hypothetical protein
MPSRCCVDANRCVHASLSGAIGDGVAQRSTRVSLMISCMATRAWSADCVKHAERARRSASRARSSAPPRRPMHAARVSAHRPQSLCPCGFSESAMTRAEVSRARRARVALLVIGVRGVM